MKYSGKNTNPTVADHVRRRHLDLGLKILNPICTWRGGGISFPQREKVHVWLSGITTAAFVCTCERGLGDWVHGNY